MTEHQDALAYAEAQVAAARDDPVARFALIERTYHGPTGRAPRHLPFRRAALSFMRWQARRGLLNALDATPPGSVWWRAVNDLLLRDGCEAVALFGGRSGAPSSRKLADAAAARAETGQLLAEFEDRQRLCEAAVCACRPREACGQLTRLARVDDLGRRKAEGVSPTDDVATSVAQVPKPIRLLAVEESDHQRPTITVRGATPLGTVGRR